MQRRIFQMDIFSFFTLIGGLALFLYGMTTMGSGLNKVAGGKLERILEKLTSNPIKAVALGTIVTAIIQSSSATTVMVVGFVNAGIMKLSQAIGVIMGANLGTTATAWILSLSGIEGDKFLIQLLKPSNFSPLLAFLGILLFMFSKSEKKKDLGQILLGFAILMFGMEAMSGAVKPLASNPEFRNILVMFSNPILGVITGAVLTAIIQSSSASVGILQALSTTGSLTFASAIPIIMGQNIGTCITALLSSIGAKKNARRAAIVHLYFNLIGTILFLLIFYIIQYTVGFSFINNSVNAASIATVHTIFNLFATITLLPFSRLLERLACFTIKNDSKDMKKSSSQYQFKGIEVLDERFLSTPGYAIQQCRNVCQKMAQLSKETFLQSITLLDHYDEELAKHVAENEDIIDKYEDMLGNFLVKLSSKELSASDSKEASFYLHSIGDFERIGDHAVNILDAAKEIHGKKIYFSEDARQELTIITDAVTEILTNAITAFQNHDTALAKDIEPLEEVIDILRNEMKNRHIKRLQKGICTIELGFVLTDILTNYERVSDHCSNIAISILQRNSDKNLDPHEYVQAVKQPGQAYFMKQFESNMARYTLPNESIS